MRAATTIPPIRIIRNPRPGVLMRVEIGYNDRNVCKPTLVIPQKTGLHSSKSVLAYRTDGMIKTSQQWVKCRDFVHTKKFLHGCTHVELEDYGWYEVCGKQLVKCDEPLDPA